MSVLSLSDSFDRIFDENNDYPKYNFYRLPRRLGVTTYMRNKFEFFNSRTDIDVLMVVLNENFIRDHELAYGYDRGVLNYNRRVITFDQVERSLQGYTYDYALIDTCNGLHSLDTIKRNIDIISVVTRNKILHVETI